MLHCPIPGIAVSSAQEGHSPTISSTRTMTSWLVISCYIPTIVGFHTYNSLPIIVSAGHYHEPPACSRITGSSCAAKCSKGAMSLAPVSLPPTRCHTRLCFDRQMAIPFQSRFGNRQLHSFPFKIMVSPALIIWSKTIYRSINLCVFPFSICLFTDLVTYLTSYLSIHTVHLQCIWSFDDGRIWILTFQPLHKCFSVPVSVPCCCRVFC